jgi:hypothetical protein
MKYWISFPVNSFETSGVALAFLHPFIRIPIKSISSSVSFEMGYEEFQLEEAVAGLHKNKDKTFSLSSDDIKPEPGMTEMSFHHSAAPYTEYFVLDLADEKDVDLPAFFVAAAGKGMTFAYKYDFWKAFWQSADLINTYKTHKRPYAHLKRMEHRIGLPILAKVDISENPGRQTLTYAMKLMAAPEMWFGPGCWDYFDKTRGASFPDAEEIQTLEGDIVYVRLFDWTTPDYEAGQILDLQERFRKWVGMDEVEAQLQERLKRP